MNSPIQLTTSAPHILSDVEECLKEILLTQVLNFEDMFDWEALEEHWVTL